MNTLSAPRVLLAAKETEGGRAFVWSFERSAPANFKLTELDAIERSTYFFTAPASWLARDGASLRALNASHSCAAVSFGFGAEWTCRLFVLDAQSDWRAGDLLRLLSRIVRELSPAVYNLYLFRRLQTRAAAVERATLARALHDGLIQSLISAEMRVHAVRRRLTDESTALELFRIEKILHQEILGVRDLMQRIKPIHLDPDELIEFLADHVNRFKSDTGINASFFADVRHVSLPGPMCSEVARVVQEALSNVRKHSGAGQVCVRLSEADGRWSLVVEDDGKGLTAPLRYPSPAVIKECVRSLRGELALQSAAGGGLRLEIRFAGPTNGDEAPAGHHTTHKPMARAALPVPDGADLVSAFVSHPTNKRLLRTSREHHGRR
jgi:signal transduction histidine kinase